LSASFAPEHCNGYVAFVQVTISQFRRELSKLLAQASNGADLQVSYKGRRFKIVPESESISRFGRITPLRVINPNSSEQDELDLKQEMQGAWEKDWELL
jgi:antitoxin (DNA-binding transcriptional repressor) of toxin-antitoxin stability system